ncbi:lecithin retinol acyltransferase a [Conger conger]|uniref:lecithin retinol acyltransferase a n=1 Tax=Conger conger TaxID=82655 RepID=UPI002A59D5BA|nr:lecithin retinol acyltransferase a [Conger conger]
MLDALAFLLEKLFVFSSLKLFTFTWSDEGKCTKRSQAPSFQRGDLFEVPRTLFTHSGIYLGENKVAHLIPDILPVLTSDKNQISKVVTNKRLILGVLSKTASIRVDAVEDFAFGSNIIVNSMDHTCKNPPLPNEDVAKRAEELIGVIPYSLLWNNCEHFVTYCRYGSAVSMQTDQFLQCLKSVVRDQRSVLLTAGLGLTSIVCFGMAPSTALPTLLIPFILWMIG